MDWADSVVLGGCSHAAAVYSWWAGDGACARVLVDRADTPEALSAHACNAGRFANASAVSRGDGARSVGTPR
jgi:hypothetical protein